MSCKAGGVCTRVGWGGPDLCPVPRGADMVSPAGRLRPGRSPAGEEWSSAESMPSPARGSTPFCWLFCRQRWIAP